MTLFDHAKMRAIPAAPANAAPIVVEAAGRLDREGRRTRTLDRVLDRLRQGPATNLELASITPRYGARVYDARQLGHRIHVHHLDGGRVLYTLQESRP